MSFSRTNNLLSKAYQVLSDPVSLDDLVDSSQFKTCFQNLRIVYDKNGKAMVRLFQYGAYFIFNIISA